MMFCAASFSVIAPASGVRKHRKRPRRASSGTSSVERIQRAAQFGQEHAFDAAHLLQHLRDGAPTARQPVLHGVEAVERGGVEGRAEEAAAVGSIGHATAATFERREARIPSGVARARPVARRAVQETAALARHRIFVSAREIEAAVGERAEIRRNRHEAVIAVDHDERLAMRHRAHDLGEVAHRKAGIEKHLAKEHQVVAAFRCRSGEPRFETVERFRRDPRDDDIAVLLQPRHLACEAHELRARRQDARRLT